MKKLLVLTDFSANANHAEAAALHIARKLGNGICLYHTLPYIPLIPSDSAGPYVTESASMLFEDSKERLIQEADKLREIDVMTQGSHVDINGRNGEGGLGDVIGGLTTEPDIEMVIMGGRSGDALEHLFGGSDTATVIRKSHRPVLIVPQDAAIEIPATVVFAADFAAADISAVIFLQEFSSRMGFSLNIVHIATPEKAVTEIGAEIAFRKYLELHALKYTQVPGTDIHRGLQQYCEEKNAGLLAMTHGKHSFFSRLFGHSEARAMISGQQIAVLIFPPEFKYGGEAQPA